MDEIIEQAARDGGLRLYSTVLTEAERLAAEQGIPMADALRMERVAILYAAELITARIASEGAMA
jgi:hypothetical protein